MKDEWQQQATRILKVELVRQDVGYKGLSGKLAQLGIEESPRQLANKINRGTFSFVFLLKCLKALGVTEIRLS
ncbi:MAG: hypothetical protein EPO19_09235 [Betaproteobacteria bacterium]|nr:MAG: hypothetical protein EPO19_09235 [Betaproteobacteria bacterium]